MIYETTYGTFVVLSDENSDVMNNRIKGTNDDSDDDKLKSSVTECKREMLMGLCCNKSPPLFLHTGHPPTIISPQTARRASSSQSFLQL